MILNLMLLLVFTEWLNHDHGMVSEFNVTVHLATAYSRRKHLQLQWLSCITYLSALAYIPIY